MGLSELGEVDPNGVRQGPGGTPGKQAAPERSDGAPSQSRHVVYAAAVACNLKKIHHQGNPSPEDPQPFEIKHLRSTQAGGGYLGEISSLRSPQMEAQHVAKNPPALGPTRTLNQALVQPAVLRAKPTLAGELRLALEGIEEVVRTAQQAGL